MFLIQLTLKKLLLLMSVGQFVIHWTFLRPKPLRFIENGKQLLQNMERFWIHNQRRNYVYTKLYYYCFFFFRFYTWTKISYWKNFPFVMHVRSWNKHIIFYLLLVLKYFRSKIFYYSIFWAASDFLFVISK